MGLFENQYHHERHCERNKQVEQAEDDQGGQDIGLIHVRQTCEENELQDTETTGSVRYQGCRKRDQKNTENNEKSGITGFGQGKIDDAGSADQFQRSDDELLHNHRHARIFQTEAADLQRA